MKTPPLIKKTWFVLLIILLAGALLRVPQLSRRPMHTDEAVHGIKFKSLLETGIYNYDPVEYHGPILNYLTLIPAFLTGAKTAADTDETLLRIVPVVFGLLLIAGLLLLKTGIGKTALLGAALLTAVSPAMAYYSRYYIQEMLLVAFTFGTIISGYRYIKSRRLLWALATGVFAGLMHSAKETSILSYFAMGCGLLVLWLSQRRKEDRFRINPLHLAGLLLSGMIISALFYSSFFTNPRGILDSFLTYASYFHKAGDHDWHVHGFLWYFRLLLFFKSGSRLWSEAFILLLAAAGMAGVLRGQTPGGCSPALAVFLAVYTCVLTLIYSLIPYKTPWIVLSFHHGFILLAGLGGALLWENIKSGRLRSVAAVMFTGGIALLIHLSMLTNFRFEADPVNPYVYGHTSPDIFRLTNAVEAIADASPEGRSLHIEVAVPGHDYWPLPWYFRSFTHVGYYDKADLSMEPAPLIIFAPVLEDDFIQKCYALRPPGEKQLFLPLCDDPVELRPGVPLSVYARKDLWDLAEQNRLSQ